MLEQLGVFQPDFDDPVIAAYERDVDRTLLRANLRLTVAQRFEQFDSFADYAAELSAAGERHRMQITPAAFG